VLNERPRLGVKLLLFGELVTKVTDVIGLYLAPPENAIVLCIDEKSRAPRGHGGRWCPPPVIAVTG
jgi:hypothetical protein